MTRVVVSEPIKNFQGWKVRDDGVAMYIEMFNLVLLSSQSWHILLCYNNWINTYWIKSYGQFNINFNATLNELSQMKPDREARLQQKLYRESEKIGYGSRLNSTSWPGW